MEEGSWVSKILYSSVLCVIPLPHHLALSQPGNPTGAVTPGAPRAEQRRAPEPCCRVLGIQRTVSAALGETKM